MRLFHNTSGLQVPYAPIFDGRLLLGMSFFSKKYSILPLNCLTKSSLNDNEQGRNPI